MKLSKSVEEYERAGGWSSSKFYKPALALMKELACRGVKVDVGRTVIYVGEKFKCYVHHNGRSKDYATITNFQGAELITAHYTEFDKIETFLRDNT